MSIVISGRVDTFYKNTSGNFVSIAKIPIGPPNAKIVSGHVYLYYYRSPDNQFTTVGSIPLGTAQQPPPPPPPPPPTSGSVDKYGVKTIYPKVGNYRYDFNTPSPSDSIRWSEEGPPLNLEATGYFKSGGTNTIDLKLHGGHHNFPDDRPGACCYIITIPLVGGDTYLRTECPHPTYKDGTSRHGAQDAASLGSINKYRGYKAIIWNKANGGVHIEAWEDQGNNDTTTTPTNQWVKLFKFDHNPGTTVGVFTTPLLGPRSGLDNHQMTFRIDDFPSTQAKWLSVTEIQPQT